MTSALLDIAIVERWLLRAGAFLLPLAFWPLTFDHHVLPKLLVARFLVLALLLLFVARTAINAQLAVKRTPLDFPLLAFIGSAVLSASVGVNLNVGIFGTYARYDGVLTLCTYAAFFWLAVQSIGSVDEARALVRALLASGFVVAAIAIIQWLSDASSSQAARAYGTMGNANVLGAFLVLLLPAAYVELLAAKSAIARLLAANAIITMSLALLVSLSRSAWIGAAIAVAILVLGRQLPALGNRIMQFAAVVLVFVIAGLAPVGLEHAASGSVSSPTTVSDRLHVWQDTIPLIAGRPILGYGPDTFGLVYPRFQTGNWGYYTLFDKAHSEVLQVAATQGAVGIAAYIWLLVAAVMAFWRGRGRPMAWGLLAGWAAYQTVLQLNFTALPAALPFWIFMAAAVVIWTDGNLKVVTVFRAPRPAMIGGIAIAAGLVVLAVPAVVSAYLADARLLQAYNLDVAGDRAAAGVLAARARQLAPQESVYSVEVGNVAFERQDWATAREAFSAAARLGSFNPEMYRNLAVADRQLGYFSDALDAARTAVYLDRFDPANQAVLAQMELLRP